MSEMPAAAELAPPVDLRLLGEMVQRLTRRVDQLDYDCFYRNEELLADVFSIQERLTEIGFVSGDALRIYRQAADLRLLVGDLASAVSSLGFAPNVAELLERELRQLRFQVERVAAGLAELTEHPVRARARANNASFSR